MALEAQNNPFTSVLMVEAADVEALPDADPAAGQRRLVVGPDHLLYLLSNLGVKTLVGAGLTDPMTTRGDLIVRNASNATARLAIGSSGKVLSSDGTDVSWQTPSAGFSDPMTTRGDVIVRNASNVTARLAIGSSGKVLQSDGTDIAWQTPTAAVNSAHGCRVHRASGDVAIGSNTMTVIPWTAEDHDTDTMHDNSTNNSRITIPSISGVTTGLWAMTAKGYSSATSGRTDVMFRANANAVNSGGTQIGITIGGPVASSGVSPIVGYEEWVLTAGDYVEVFFRSTAGSFNLTFDSVTLPSFSMAFLGKVS